MVDALVLETNKVFCVGSSPSVLNYVFLRYGESGITTVSEAVIIGSNPIVLIVNF